GRHCGFGAGADLGAVGRRIAIDPAAAAQRRERCQAQPEIAQMAAIHRSIYLCLRASVSRFLDGTIPARSVSKSGRRDWAGRIALIAASVVVSLALLEVGS